MVEVTRSSANWRLFGGGGIALGGLVWAIGGLLAVFGLAPNDIWTVGIGSILIGIGFLFLAFGQSGSNGIVGALTWGKIALVIAGVAMGVLGVLNIAGATSGGPALVTAFTGGSISVTLAGIALAVFLIAGIVSAVAIYRRGVAQGIAKWALFVAVVGAFWWSFWLIGVIFLGVGLSYLFNKVGR